MNYDIFPVLNLFFRCVFCRLITYQKRDRELGGAWFTLDICRIHICRISWIYRQILLLVATVQLSMSTMIIVQLKMIVRNDLNILSSSFSSFSPFSSSSSSSSSSSHVISAPPLSKWNSSTKFCTVIDSNSLHSYHRSDIAFLKGFLPRLVTRTTMTTTDPQQTHSLREACLSPSGEFTMVRTRFSCKYRSIFRKRPHVWSCYGTRETMSLSFEQLILEIWNTVIIHISQFIRLLGF